MVLADSLVGSLRGNEALFLPLVFLHVISALAGFGSVGFAGTYAGRAAHLALGDGAPRPRRALASRSPLGVEPGPEPAPQAAAAPEAPALPIEPEAAEEPALPIEPEASEEPALPIEPEASEDPEVEELTRYFERPARFWKAVILVPVFGLLALWAQPHTKGLDQLWALAALLIWVAAILVVAGLVVPALGRMRGILLPGGMGEPGVASPGARAARLAQAGRIASRAAAFCDILFLIALALMIWQP